MYIIAWANKFTDFNWIWRLQHLDMIKLRLGFGEFYLFSYLDLRRSSSEGDSTIKILI